MARPLTPQSVNTIIGGVTILVVLLVFSWIYFFQAKVATQPATARQYNLTVISQDLQAPDATNVFVKTVPLAAPQQGTTGSSTGVTYSSSDIGKQDLTQLGK